MAQRAVVDLPKNKSDLTQSQIEQENQDDQARDRMAGESPAYQRSIGNQRVPRLNSLVKTLEKSRPGVFPIMIGFIAVGTLMYLSSKRSLG